jgi:uncharacterized protein YidB (DUF937 family)
MAKRFPSLAALLGLVAIAGYQNRDKIGEFVKKLGGPDSAGGVGGMIEGVKKAVTSGDIKGGLGELVDQFKNAGQGDTVDSWVGKGPNAQISQTGLSREELLSRLSKVLPEAVDKLTPDGKLPA